MGIVTRNKLFTNTSVLVSDQASLCGVARDYFVELFSPIAGTYDPVVEAVKSKVTPEDNILLLASFTKIEFHMAVKQMHPNKSSGPDGLNPDFYQHFWDLCGDEIFLGACK